jgi:hypothetical protein
VRFDQKALRYLLCIGKSDYIKDKAKKRRKTGAALVEDDLDLPPLRPNGAANTKLAVTQDHLLHSTGLRSANAAQRTRWRTRTGSCSKASSICVPLEWRGGGGTTGCGNYHSVPYRLGVSAEPPLRHLLLIL